MRQWISLITVILLLAGLVLVLRPYCQRLSDATPHPAETKLGDFKGRVFNTNFVAPIGELFNIVITSDAEGDLKHQLKGSILVRHDNKAVAEFSLDPNTVKECNWFSKYGLSGYILTWHSTSNVLEHILRAGNSYDVVLSLEEPLDRSASLWLTYIQPFREYKKSRNVVRPK